MKTPELLIIGGKPFSGKSTISRTYAAQSNNTIKHLSMGERLRAISKGEVSSHYSEALAKSEGALKAHDPVAKELPIAVFEEFIREESPDLVLLDAFPRYPDRLDLFRRAVNR